MTQKTAHKGIHAAHSIPGRIRLKADKLKGHPRHAHEVSRKLAAIEGIHKAEVNPTTGSITLHYHPLAPQSVKFFEAIAVALGLIAAEMEVGEIEALFEVTGISETDLFGAVWKGISALWEGLWSKAGGDRAEERNLNFLPALAIFTAGFLAGCWID